MSKLDSDGMSMCVFVHVYAKSLVRVARVFINVES